MRFDHLRLTAILSLVAGGCLIASPLAAANYVEGEALVTFKDSITLQAATNALSKHQFGLAKHFRAISQSSGRHIGLVRKQGSTTAQIINELQRDPAVLIAEPNFLRHPFATLPNGTPP